MKKRFFGIILVFMLIMGCAGVAPQAGKSGEKVTTESSSGRTAAESSGGGTTARSSGGMDLDAAIREAAAQMGENLSGGTKIALVSVASSSTQFSEYVISRLEAALVNGKKLVVVDRANLDKVRAEQGFQLSGEVDDNSAKSIGKLLGAGAIVTGSFANIGDMYTLSLKAINIDTATVAVSYPQDIAGSTRIEVLLASGGGAGTGPRTAQTGGRAAVASAGGIKDSYAIGDTGPAGGIVFYDKGVHVDGWRYLEAASQNIGSGTPWDVNGRSVSGTSTAVGAGKRNTEIMAEAGITAGQIVRQYSQGEYKDWFLPSKDELDFMYQNLKQRGFGNFSSGQYWSSSVYGGSLAWAQSFSDGSQTPPHMDIRSIRAVRAF